MCTLVPPTPREIVIKKEVRNMMGDMTENRRDRIRKKI